MDLRFIAIEGNIGVGKSTLAGLLVEHYQARYLPEVFEDNNFLPRFYADPERYAFPLELSFLADRYKQLKEVLVNRDLFRQRIISDYLFTKCKLFARVNLRDEEYDLFQKLFDIIDLQLPAPDLLIYLRAPVGKLLENIEARGRSYEQGITADYLEKVSAVYEQHLKQQTTRTLTIDTTHADFSGNPAHFKQLIQFLDEGPDFRTWHMAIGRKDPS